MKSFLNIIIQIQIFKNMQKELYEQEDLSLRENAFDPKSEQVILSMWERMKSLESKYIDLANYYKQELIQTKNPLDTSNSSKSAVGGVINPAQQPGARNEDTIINDLKSEKIRFEQNIKAVIASAEFGGQQDVQITNEQLIRLNNEIQGAFKDILDHVDDSQSNAVQNISQRQTEMFQLTTKYRLSSGFKNDAVGVWYDAKTGVTQQLQKLRQFVEEKGVAVMAQTFQPKSTPSENVQKKEDYISLIKRFEQDMVILKQGSKDYNQSIQMIKQALNDNEKMLARDKEALTRDYKGLIESLDDVLMGGKKDDILSQASRGPASSSGVTSPFGKKVNTLVNRSGSRGPLTNKPPKLSYQQSALLPKASPLRSPYSKKNTFFDINEVHPDLRALRNKMVQYDASVDQFLSDQATKEEKIDEMVRRMEAQVQGNVMKFLATHDVDLVRQYFTNTVLTPTETAMILAQANLEAHSNQQKLQTSASSSNIKSRQSVSPYRGTRPGVDPPGFRKSTPTRPKSKLQSIRTPSKDFGSSSRFQATGESVRLQELQNNTDSLFNELRRANDKCIEQQVENRKLKDKVQVLSLQIEDLRINNNRYQQQVIGYQAKPKKTKTTRTGQSPYSHADGPSVGTSIASGGDIGEEIELCKRIDQFFSAMKLLQRAVNKKEDISELKVEFETKQRQLQRLSKQIQSKNSDKQHNSQYMGSEPSVVNENLQTIKNRSHSSRGLATTSARGKFKGTTSTSPLRPSTSKMISPKPSNRPDQNQDIINTQKQTIKSLEQSLYEKQTAYTQVIAQIKNFESYQTQKYQNLQNRLEQREQELDSVKSLFVERLRELELNFAEIGDHLIANQDQKQKKLPEPAPQTETKSHLQKFFIDDTNDREADEKFIEQLTETNTQLHDQIAELKRQYKDFIEPSQHQKLKEQLNDFDNQIRMLNKEKLHLVKMFDTLSKERDAKNEEFLKAKQDKSAMQTEVNKMTQQINNAKLDKEKQEMLIEESIKKIQQQLKDEVEQRMCFQKESRDNDNLIKLLEEENEGLQTQMASMEMERAQIKHQMEMAEEKNEKMDDQVKTLQEKNEVLKEEKQELEAENNARQEQLDETEEQLLNLREILKTKDEELQQSQDLIEKLEDELRDVKVDQSDKDEIEKLKKSIKESRLKQEELEKEQEMAEEAIRKKEEDLEKAKAEAQKKVEEAELAAQKKLEEQEKAIKKKLEEAELQTKQKLEETEIAAQKKLEEAELSNKKKLEEAEMSTKKKLEEAEMSTKKQLEEVEVASQQKLKQVQEISIQQVEEAQAVTTQLKEQAIEQERKNWWMTALQLRVKKSLQLKLEKQNQEVALLKDQLQSKELGDSEQLKQLTQKESDLRQKLEEEMNQKSQEIDMIKTQWNLEIEKDQREIQKMKEVEAQKLKEIEELNIQKAKELEEIKKQKEDEVENLKKATTAAEQEKAKALDDLKKTQQEKEKAVESLKKSEQQKVEELQNIKKLLEQEKAREFENNKKLEQERAQEIENIRKSEQQKAQELENLKKSEQEKALEIENIRKSEQQKAQELENLKKSEQEKAQEIENLKKSDQEKSAKIESEKNLLLDSLKEKLSGDIKQKEQEIEKLKSENEQLQQDLSTLNSTNLQEIASYKKQLEDLKDNSTLDEQLYLLEDKLDLKENEITKLTDLNDDLDLKISEQLQEIEELKTEIKELQEKMQVDNDLVTMLLAEKKEAKENAVEMENIIEELEKQLNKEKEESKENAIEMENIIEKMEKEIEQQQDEIEQLKKGGSNQAADLQQKFEQSQKEIQDLKIKYEKEKTDMQQEMIDLKTKDEKALSDLKIKNYKEISDLKSQLQSNSESLEKAEQEIKKLKQKLDEVHQDMSQKVDSGHDNVKKIVDIHKTNEELSEQLLSKVEQCKILEQDLESQRTAYEVLLDQLAKVESSEASLIEQVQNFEIQNKKASTSFSRNSMGSDDDYSSVSEMKDHLKHARQILIQFITKLPFSSADNEATLPIIFSMFEFTKQEQEKVTEARMQFNQEKIAGEVKDKSKKLFGNFMKKKGVKTDGSFNSGGNNTNQSQGR